MPQRSSTSSPSDTPPLAAASFAPPPWRTDLWQGAYLSVPTGGLACRIGCTVGGGDFPPPELPRCPVNSSIGSEPESMYLSPIGLGIPPPGSSAGLPWPERPFDKSAALPPWPRFSNSVAPLPLAHAESSCHPPQIPPSSTTCTTHTGPAPSVAPYRWGPPPLSISRTPPPTYSPPPGRVGRPC